MEEEKTRKPRKKKPVSVEMLKEDSWVNVYYCGSTQDAKQWLTRNALDGGKYRAVTVQFELTATRKPVTVEKVILT